MPEHAAHPDHPGRAKPPGPRTPAANARTVRPAPVGEKERFQSIDVVRGFALLGILIPNIVAFSWPGAAMTDPSIIDAHLGTSNPWNEIGHDLTAVFTLGKMMALFSMLFGAGVIIYARKFDGDADGVSTTCERCRHDLAGLPTTGLPIAGQDDPPTAISTSARRRVVCPACGTQQTTPRRLPLSVGAGLWYRRTAWLLVIGLLHATLLWFGDILVIYALAGCGLLWWARRWNPTLQIGVGLAAHLFSTLLMVGISALAVWAIRNGEASPDDLAGDPAREFAGYAGSYLDTFAPRLFSLAFFWLLFIPIFYPGITGLMLIGMGLTRLRILTGERPTRLYAWMAILGIGGGLGLTATLYYATKAVFPEFAGFIWQSCSQFIGIPISLGYMGLLIWIVRLGVLRTVSGALANVGRMALSNYLLQTILCTTFFYGYGGGRYATIDYPGLFAVVAAVWTINIVFSTLWLSAFRFGPAEWAWRSLTYWKLQPLRR